MVTFKYFFLYKHFLVFLCFNRPVVRWFSYLGLVLGFFSQMHIASFYCWIGGHSSLEEERLGKPWWIQLCYYGVNVSLHIACCLHSMWGNAPLMPGRKRDIIWFPTCPILYSQNRCMPPWRPVVVSSPCKIFPMGLWCLGEQHQWWLSVTLVCCWQEAASLHQA